MLTTSGSSVDRVPGCEKLSLVVTDVVVVAVVVVVCYLEPTRVNNFRGNYAVKSKTEHWGLFVGG